jgi:hypothetical protein
MHDYIVGDAGMEERNEPGRAVGSTDTATGEKAGGRRASSRKATDGQDTEQGSLRSDSPTPTEEGDWVLVYDSSLHNQHKATRKFARRWFGPYVVRRVDDNGTYHLAELDGTRIANPVAGKRVKAFKKRHDDEPDARIGWGDDDEGDDDEGEHDTDGTDGEIVIEI